MPEFSDPPPSPGLLHRSFGNLFAVPMAMLPFVNNRNIHASLSDALVAIVVLIAVQTGLSLYYGYELEWLYDTIVSALGSTIGHLILLGLGLLLLGRFAKAPMAAIGVIWALVWAGAIIGLIWTFQPNPDGRFLWFAYFSGPSIILPALFCALYFGRDRAGYVGLLLFISMGIESLDQLGISVSSLFAENAEEVAQETRPAIPDTEALYAAQDQLLGDQIRALTPSNSSVPELFAVLGAGYPYQGVFLRETLAVSTLLETRFAADNKVVSLANSAPFPYVKPLLNRTNLTKALAAVGTAMGPEDVALVFLTSHGAQDLLSTRFNGATSRDLTASDVATALDASGIGTAIIVVSACYSGSFVDDLQAPNRLILTASRADRNSFGCSDTNEWTDWGRAFFVDALQETSDFREAARIAKALVAEREADQGLTPSEPQIIEGDAFSLVYDRFVDRLNLQTALNP